MLTPREILAVEPVSKTKSVAVANDDALVGDGKTSNISEALVKSLNIAADCDTEGSSGG